MNRIKISMGEPQYSSGDIAKIISPNSSKHPSLSKLPSIIESNILFLPDYVLLARIQEAQIQKAVNCKN